MSDLGRSLKNLLKTALKKLREISALNALLILALLVYVAFDSVSGLLTAAIYAFGDTWGQLFANKRVQYSADYTPQIIYLGFILIAFMFCMWIVKKHKKGSLW